MEADLNRLQKEGDALRQTRTRKPFPASLPRDEKQLQPAEACCPDCGDALSYLGRRCRRIAGADAQRLPGYPDLREKHVCTKCDAIERGIAGPGLLARVLSSKYAEYTPMYRQSEIYSCQV